MKQFGKFLLVGSVSTTINYGIFALLFRSGFHYLLAAAIGFLSGVFLAFFLNKRYTFESKEKEHAKQMVQYYGVNIFSLVVNLFSLAIFVKAGINVYIANLIAIGISTITNFLGSKIVFRK